MLEASKLRHPTCSFVAGVLGPVSTAAIHTRRVPRSLVHHLADTLAIELMTGYVGFVAAAETSVTTHGLVAVDEKRGAAGAMPGAGAEARGGHGGKTGGQSRDW